MWFEILLRLKINLENNKLIQIGSIPNIELLAGKLGCKVGCVPSTYFWIVLGLHHKSMVGVTGLSRSMTVG